mmetsp:Transcript_1195/g.3779  ORF Transcript_1195/g.3779 Transcript_1195/m.3779 type:complete len:282 (-) Transcript_1195:229-1074(-)
MGTGATTPPPTPQPPRHATRLLKDGGRRLWPAQRGEAPRSAAAQPAGQPKAASRQRWRRRASKQLLNYTKLLCFVPIALHSTHHSSALPLPLPPLPCGPLFGPASSPSHLARFTALLRLAALLRRPAPLLTSRPAHRRPPPAAASFSPPCPPPCRAPTAVRTRVPSAASPGREPPAPVRQTRAPRRPCHRGALLSPRPTHPSHPALRPPAAARPVDGSHAQRRKHEPGRQSLPRRTQRNPPGLRLTPGSRPAAAAPAPSRAVQRPRGVRRPGLDPWRRPAQ